MRTACRSVLAHDSTDKAGRVSGDALGTVECTVGAIVAARGGVFTAQLVNLTVLDSEGLPMREANVPLLQGNDKREPGQRCAEWMPYQKGQAAKTEALEQSLGPRAQ